MSDRIIGTVIRANPAGYGFLITQAGDIFFHASDLPPDIPFHESVGRRFDFALESENGRRRAGDIYEFTGETFTGCVRPILPARDFAFIRRDDATEIFFHRADVRGDFASLSGKSVSFQIQETPRGPRAVCVEPTP